MAVVGRDPRASGEMLEAAVVAGLTSAGANVLRVGVLPTPGIAYLTAESRADLGVVLSASHNPMPDNGIKLFASGGHKLPDEVEDAIESAVAAQGQYRPPAGPGHEAPRSSGRQPAEHGWQRPTAAGVGRVRDMLDGAEHYIKHLVE